jgi:hypothetical protein
LRDRVLLGSHTWMPWLLVREPHRNRCVLQPMKMVSSMVSSKYYRRQSDLCLQLSLLQADPRMTLLLVELAKELQAKADEAGSAPTSVPIFVMDPRQFFGFQSDRYGLKPPDPRPRHRAREIQQA